MKARRSARRAKQAPAEEERPRSTEIASPFTLLNGSQRGGGLDHFHVDVDVFSSLRAIPRMRRRSNLVALHRAR